MQDGRNAHASAEDVRVVMACFAADTQVVEVGFAEVEGEELGRGDFVDVGPDFEAEFGGEGGEEWE
jgi:hypothetical protein